jgi:hypothetical protein
MALCRTIAPNYGLLFWRSAILQSLAAGRVRKEGRVKSADGRRCKLVGGSRRVARPVLETAV